MVRSFKRQFQPSISSYFGSNPGDLGTVNDRQTADPAPSIRSPSLPAAIQSSLLNVGMRVRKSVPEGYQTGMKTSYSYGPSVSYEGPSTTTSEHMSILPLERTPEHPGLVPYCGILKTGGLAAQPVPAEEDLPPLQFDDEWSLPSSSQTSNASSVMTAVTMPSTMAHSANRKRRREDADDEDLGLASQPVSPRSRPISHTRMPNLDQIRPIVLPKSRRKIPVADDIGGGTTESEMIDVGDFGEAPFFRPEEWGEHWV